MSPTTFRWILVASFVLALTGGSIDLVVTSLVPEALSSAQAASDTEIPLLGLVSIVIVGLAASIATLAAYYGLFVFKPWAPRLAIVGTVLSLPLWPMFGVSISSGWSLALTEASNLLWGAAIAAAHFSALKEKFSAPR
ncbi:hypothetical protein [Ferribacterium limneticum]|uniref:hypothetical protein n=1 Tax=Ferribacterium limneticum TaxID=76259 RepID=UPI001CF87093|nr:hypothetical protein [Ferribacterium limneticum]UCV21673.1 hypothetical protein KI613_14125 [Ferribacterium limneticum]